jgi:hypothetical protein
MGNITEDYNGHANYPTWVAASWASNDQPSYERFQRMAAVVVADVQHPHWTFGADDVDAVPTVWATLERARVYELQRQLDDDLRARSPLAEASGVYSDLLSAAIELVDHRAAAEALLDDHYDRHPEDRPEEVTA